MTKRKTFLICWNGDMIKHGKFYVPESWYPWTYGDAINFKIVSFSKTKELTLIKLIKCKAKT